MNKNWKSASWPVRLVFIYWFLWLLPVLVAGSLWGYVIYSYRDAGIDIAWNVPFDFLHQSYQQMPISTSIDIVFVLMSLLGIYYAWRLLKGSGISRAILEMFSWLIVLVSLIYAVFPEAQYFELEEVAPELFERSGWEIMLTWIVLLLEVGALVLIRCTAVKAYADVY